jgi:hypothetical protein
MANLVAQVHIAVQDLADLEQQGQLGDFSFDQWWSHSLAHTRLSLPFVSYQPVAHIA